jgi:hypothetical protein
MAGAGLTVMDRDCDAVAVVQQATCTVKLAVPVVMGAPVKAPVEELSEMPAGRAPEVIDQVLGVVPPVEAMV